uniref:Uncharacterized protein n=1 Tax=Oryza meridionalis TaxID=40149 RepID=A0A0E0E424_9ORYZ
MIQRKHQFRSLEPNVVISPVSSTLTASAVAAWPPAPMTTELATAAAAPLLQKPVLTIHDVDMATHFPNDVFSYIGHIKASSSPPPVSSNTFVQAVIPPGSLQTNYAIHEAPDFDLNIFFADVLDVEQDELAHVPELDVDAPRC